MYIHTHVHVRVPYLYMCVYNACLVGDSVYSKC